MALTCGIQALYDNNREVWFTSGLHSAGQQLHNRRCLWDDVIALQDRGKKQFAAMRGGMNTHTHTHYCRPPGTEKQYHYPPLGGVILKYLAIRLCIF